MYGGYAAYLNGWVFFSNPEDNGYLYRCDKKLSNMQLVCDIKTDNIFLTKTHVWFRNADNLFCRMKIDDNSLVEIIIKRPCRYIYVNDDAIFFGAKENYTNCLFKTNLDGSNELILSYYTDEILVTENEIFYTTDGDDPYLYKCDHDGKRNNRINDLATINITKCGDYLYFCQGDCCYGDRDYKLVNFHRMRVQRGNKNDRTPLYKSECITESDVAYINSDDKYVYFQIRGYERPLMRYDTVDKTFKCITKGSAYFPQIINNKIFYREDGLWSDSKSTFKFITRSGKLLKTLTQSKKPSEINPLGF
jgi:hypothetical protein